MQVILLRHGDYDSSGNLSHKGREQYIQISESLKPYREDIHLLSSSAPRASQSAEVIAHKLSLSIEHHDKLWSDNTHKEDFTWLYSLILQKQELGIKVLVIISHLEYVQDFPRKFGLPSNDSGYAQGIVINTVSKAYSVFPQFPGDKETFKGVPQDKQALEFVLCLLYARSLQEVEKFFAEAYQKKVFPDEELDTIKKEILPLVPILGPSDGKKVVEATRLRDRLLSMCT